MEKVDPILYKELTPGEYAREFKRIDSEIDQITDWELETIITTDIPFRIYYLQSLKRDFEALLADDIHNQRMTYKMFLYSVYQFPQFVFQRN